METVRTFDGPRRRLRRLHAKQTRSAPIQDAAPTEPRLDHARVRFLERVRAGQSPRAPDDLRHRSFGDGPAEVVLLDKAGVIRSADAAWIASLEAQGLEVAGDGIGLRYVDVCRVAFPELDEVGFKRELDELLAGRLQQFEGTYRIETDNRQKLRRVRITPLQLGHASYFIAIHENLTERAQVLAALDEVSDELLHAQERERRRIAIELHDSMSQHLAGLALSLGAMRKRVGDDPAVGALLDDLAKLVQRALQETRVLSYQMNASGDGREGLASSVLRLVDGFGRRTHLDTNVVTTGRLDSVSPAVQHAVFRVIQEALSNVYRHALATRVSVRLTSQREVLTVRIADDGQGMGMQLPLGLEESGPRLGVGISGMFARMRQLGGTLAINTRSRRGTVVTASVPIDGPRRPSTTAREARDQSSAPH